MIFSNLIYLDANVFIYASLDRKSLGERSRSIIREIQEGKILASSSAVSFDEIVWAVRKVKGDALSVEAGEIFLSMPGLAILDVNQTLLSSSLDLIKRYHLKPRDSVHAASAIDSGAEFIVTEDPDFDAITQIKRKPILNA